MASAGVTINRDELVALNKTDAFQRILALLTTGSGGYFDGTKASPVGDSMITVERRYVPTWAIVVAIIGLFLFLLGLLALLVRSKEACSITFSAEAGGTRIRITGTMSSELALSINSFLSQHSLPARQTKGGVPSILQQTSELSDEWKCAGCGKINSTPFCSQCGARRPDSGADNENAVEQ